MPTRNVLLTRKSCKIINPAHCPRTQGKNNFLSYPQNQEAPSDTPSNTVSLGLSLLPSNKKKLFLGSILDKR